MKKSELASNPIVEDPFDKEELSQLWQYCYGYDELEHFYGHIIDYIHCRYGSKRDFIVTDNLKVYCSGTGDDPKYLCTLDDNYDHCVPVFMDGLVTFNKDDSYTAYHKIFYPTERETDLCRINFKIKNMVSARYCPYLDIFCKIGLYILTLDDGVLCETRFDKDGKIESDHKPVEIVFCEDYNRHLENKNIISAVYCNDEMYIICDDNTAYHANWDGRKVAVITDMIENVDRIYFTNDYFSIYTKIGDITNIYRKNLSIGKSAKDHTEYVIPLPDGYDTSTITAVYGHLSRLYLETNDKCVREWYDVGRGKHVWYELAIVSQFNAEGYLTHISPNTVVIGSNKNLYAFY